MAMNMNQDKPSTDGTNPVVMTGAKEAIKIAAQWSRKRREGKAKVEGGVGPEN